VGAILLSLHLSPNVKNVRPSYQPNLWLKSALPMLLIGSMYVINNQTDTIMLGTLSTTEAVGIYTVANRGAGLITFVLLAFDTAIAPTFASLYARGELAQLQKIVTQTCQVVFAVAVLFTVILIVFGKWLLLIFGSEFVKGHLVLSILSCGQLVNAFTGSVALLLIMTGYDKCTAIGVGFSAILNIILNAVFIPRWSAEGAALATAISMIFWNLILIYYAQQKLRINSTPLNVIKIK
jgi:O-antigen/teichoic acid export membrane protein